MKRFAVFDIDGTLIRWQLYHAAVDKLAKNGALGPDTHQKIHEARMKWKRREDADGFKEYESTLIKFYAEALPKLSTAQFDTVAEEIVSEYQDQAYSYTRDLLKQLKSRGYTLLAISGSQQELVAKIAQHYGFDDFIASQYERSGKGFTGKVFVASSNKKSALMKLVEKHKLDFTGSYGIGDSASDSSMLELVENPVAFNPDSELFQSAKANGWKIVVERKNMVYEMEQQNGRYILV
jgi:HAD superfamily hydrolase (TIGR01490 family)